MDDDLSSSSDECDVVVVLCSSGMCRVAWWVSESEGGKVRFVTDMTSWVGAESECEVL